MRKTLLILLAVAFIPAIALCADEDQNNNLQLGINYSDPQGNPRITIGGIRSRLEIDNDNGYYFNYERKLSDPIGLSFGATVNDYDVDIGGNGPFHGHVGALKTIPLTANVLFHPAANAPIDFYIGGGYAHVRYDDIKIRSNLRPLFSDDRISLDNDNTWNAQLGVNIKFGDSHVGLSVDGKYIKTTADASQADLKVDPLNVGAGLLFRW